METAGYDSSRPLAEQVAQRIKDYILEEKLKSGDKLPTETALAREMGVARSTVREAIKRLESQNILTVRHGAGSFVTDQPGLADDPLGLDFIEDKERLAFDLLEVRNIIEPAIAALAARHATPEDIAEMESLYNLMEYHILRQGRIAHDFFVPYTLFFINIICNEHIQHGISASKFTQFF